MKKDTITIETPEKIIFSYTIAGLGSRFGAFVLDYFIQFLAIILLVIMLQSAFNFSVFKSLEGGSDILALSMAFFLIVKFILDWGYFLLWEILTNGQSPGKKIFRIRVIRSRGEPLDFSALALRNLLRAVDSFPFMNLLGGIVAVVDKRSRRLGDLVADTLVVNDHRINLKEPDFRTKMHYLVDGRQAIPILLDRSKKLSEDELYIIRRFLNERDSLPSGRRNPVTYKLVEQVSERLGIKAEGVEPLRFLEMIYREHTYEDH